MSEKNIASFAVDLVVTLGSKTVFSLTGGMAMYLNAAAANNKNLKNVYCQHEQACVAAAEGFAKASNFKTAGFAIVTAGPGVSNAVTSLISAYGDSVPLVVLAGQIKSQDIDKFGTRTHGIQEINSKALIAPVVKKFIRITRKNYQNQLVNGIAEAFLGRPGPVFIEFPLDIQGAKISYSNADLKAAAKIIVDKVNFVNSVNLKLDQFLLALTKVEKPLLYLGNGCRIAGVEAEVLSFAKKYNIPCIFSWLSFDALPFDAEINMGCPGGLAPIYSNKLLSEAQMILFLGARLDLGTTAFQRESFGKQARKIFVDIDQSELLKFKRIKDAKLIRANLKSLKGLSRRLSGHKTLKNWLSYCQSLKAKYMEEELARLKGSSLTVYEVTQKISEICADKVIIPASSGYAEETFTRFFQPKRNTRFFNGAALGAMGLGLPHAIGASCATKKQVICLEADGGIMLNLQELATLKQLAPPKFILIILNNYGYESIRASQNRHFGKLYGADESSGLFIPDFSEISASFKLKYARISTLKELGELNALIDGALAPLVIDISVDRQEYRGPSVKTVINSKGKISSTSLRDISW